MPLGDEGWKLAGIFCATYIGGSLNYVAASEVLDLRSGDLLAAGIAADNLAMTLYDLLGYHIKANPKYGSEKKGQPTTYYLSAAPEPIRINCEYFYVDVVLSPDPNVFGHSNALAGLKKGGVLVMQSDAATAEEFWSAIPRRYRKIIVDNDIRVFYLDAFRIARDEATDPELQLRMQGIAFHQGACAGHAGFLVGRGEDHDRFLQVPWIDSAQ